MLNPQFWWYLTRASGIVAWVLLTATTLWGILLSTRLLKPYDRPAWLLDLHRWLGSLTVLIVGLHLASLIADSYVHFGVADLFVPMATSWKPLAVAWGIIAMYLLVAVQASSLLMNRLPKKLWHGVHLASYVMFVIVSIHSLTAGTDRSASLFQALTVALITLMIAFTGVRLVYSGKPRTRDVLSRVRQTQLPPPESSPLD